MLAASHFNADYYVAIAPIFLLALVVQLRVSDLRWITKVDPNWADATYLVVSLLLDEGGALTAPEATLS